MSTNSKAPDPKKTRTQKAILANMRGKEERYAALLVERGWGVLSPYENTEEDIRKSRIWEQQVIDMLVTRGWKVTLPEV